MLKVIADVPVGEGIPMNGVQTGPRSPNWQALKPSTLYWVEALDGGDPEKDVPFRDKIMVLPAPFTGEPKEVFKTENRFGGFTWFADARTGPRLRIQLEEALADDLADEHRRTRDRARRRSST